MRYAVWLFILGNSKVFNTFLWVLCNILNQLYLDIKWHCGFPCFPSSTVILNFFNNHDVLSEISSCSEFSGLDFYLLGGKWGYFSAHVTSLGGTLAPLWELFMNISGHIPNKHLCNCSRRPYCLFFSNKMSVIVTQDIIKLSCLQHVVKICIFILPSLGIWVK